MSKLSNTFTKKKTLIAYVTAGDPSLAATEKLVLEMEKAGADIVELGIPFSDPLADGPVIQASHQRAMKHNVSLSDALKLVAKLRKKTNLPLCFMLSYNLILKYGRDKFYADCQKAGVDGAIVPDLPPEEEGARGIDQIFLLAPTSSDERIKIVAERASGFIYLVSVAGVTGKKTALAGNLPELISKIRVLSKLSIAVGFGISTPQQAREVAQLSDGVIVGSALVDLIARKKFKAVSKLVAALRRALDAQ